MSLTRKVIPFLLSLLAATPAQALTLDAFVDDGFVSSTATVGTTKNIFIASTQALGGGRTL